MFIFYIYSNINYYFAFNIRLRYSYSSNNTLVNSYIHFIKNVYFVVLFNVSKYHTVIIKKPKKLDFLGLWFTQ
nr:MAG TPA: hypothetical protein [Bacteriophage sp.]